jgi:tetratricopeptide (TPR) repeat protein
MGEDPTESGDPQQGAKPGPLDEAVAQPHLDAAAVAIGKGEWAAAEEAFAQGLAASPRDPRLHGGLALVAIQEQDWQRAVAHGRQAVALGAASAEVHNNLGWALEQSGQEEEAEAAYTRAFETDPTRPEPIHHLLRLGVVPGCAGDPEAATIEIGTLLRLDLYRSLAARLKEDACRHSWLETYNWIHERGAPWGEVVGWLMQQGVHCDCEVLTTLSQRDEHLADSVISGMLLGDSVVLAKLLDAVKEVKLLQPSEELLDQDRQPREGEEHIIVVQLVDDGTRVQIPSQRCHAGLVYHAIGDLLPMLGEDAAMVLTVDPVAHLGPRRVWMLGGIAEAEVVGTWSLFDSDGEQVGADMRLTPIPLSSDSMPLQLPGIDAASLESAVDESGLRGPVRVDPEGERLWFDADTVGRVEDEWTALLTRLSGWIPEESRSFASWRKGADYRLAVLERSSPLRTFEMRPSWPSNQDTLDLPLDEKVQLLARAVFMAPRSSRFF